VLVLAGAFAVTAMTLVLALVLGSLAFDYRRHSQHDIRLHRVLEQHPSIERLTQGLEEEGSPLLAAPGTAADVERTIVELGRDRGPELRQKAKRWRHLRVFAAADMLYFVFFDEEGEMRDFTLVCRI
jgi:hypothetical protein